MDKLDGLVTEYLVERLLKPECLAVMLSALKARRTAKAEGENKRIMALQREAAQADDRLKRPYRLVEDDVTDLNDILKEDILKESASRRSGIAQRRRLRRQNPGTNRIPASTRPY